MFSRLESKELVLKTNLTKLNGLMQERKQIRGRLLDISEDKIDNTLKDDQFDPQPIHEAHAKLMENYRKNKELDEEQNVNIKSNYIYVLVILGILAFLFVIGLIITMFCNYRITFLKEKLLDLKSQIFP